MGYETTCRLRSTGSRDDLVRVLIEVAEMPREIALDLTGGAMTTKWWKPRPIILEISRRLQDVTLTLEGDGEENEDLWVEEYLNGRYRRSEAIITMSDFTDWKEEDDG